MAQYRQLGAERFAVRNNDFHKGNGISDQISSTASKIAHKQGKVRRSYVRGDRNRVIYVTGAIVIFSFTLTVIVFYFNYLSSAKEFNRVEGEDDGTNSELDFFYNGTQTTTNKVLKFGHGSVHHGRDSRDWDRDDRRRDDEYNEDEMDVTNAYRHNESVESKQISSDENGSRNKVEVKDIHLNSQGLYNEAGRDELKHYEEKYEESLKNGVDRTFQSNLSDSKLDNTDVDPDDEYDDGLDSNDVLEEKSNDKREDNVGKLPNTNSKSTREAKSDSFKFETAHPSKQVTNRFLVSNKDSIRKSSNTEKKLDPKRKGKRHKFSGSSCEMKLLSSTAHLIEPSENPKSARFTLQYTEREEKPSSSEDWKPRFAGHQSLQEREASFYAHDQVINCGFVKGKKGSPSTGFDLSEDDEKFMSSCHIAVSSCIFGASDNLRTPTNKSVTRLSRKNVCFVMFVDENTLKTLSSEGQKPDAAGYIGLWRIIVVKNLPYDDMRRVGKIPKFLAHRLFPSARYSIWLDSKLRLERDPLLILEYFLWRHNYDYAISNHYDRHCVWEEVLQNKKLNKFNHTIIDQQFQFYQADGLKRFNPLDSNKLLPSYVPEGSFIVRAHSPMSNLFSCLWFNEVDRFTPRDQLSFAYTYLKMRRMNPDKPFYLNMFKDCERRSIAKLFRHRSEDKRNPPLQSTI